MVTDRSRLCPNPKLWNELILGIRESAKLNINIYKTVLETHLFWVAYNF